MSTTAQELLNAGANFLKLYSIDQPFLNCNLMLQKSLNLRSQEQLLMHGSSFVSEKAKLSFISMLHKRCVDRIPLSHILGSREFFSINFITNQHVLDPRPDSETIVEVALKIFNNPIEPISILDLGSGSGCLCISIAKNLKNATCISYEKSPKAASITLANIQQHRLQNRIKVRNKDWNTLKTGQFDLIISNPPYIRRTEINSLQPEIKKHEPLIALDGGTTGIKLYPEIFRIIRSRLTHDGIGIVEIAPSQERRIRNMAIKHGLTLLGKAKDLSGSTRCVLVSISQNHKAATKPSKVLDGNHEITTQPHQNQKSHDQFKTIKSPPTNLRISLLRNPG